MQVDKPPAQILNPPHCSTPPTLILTGTQALKQQRIAPSKKTIGIGLELQRAVQAISLSPILPGGPP